MGTPGTPGVETDVQTIPCSAIETDDAGNPVTLDPTAVTWAIAPDANNVVVASVTPNADGSATFKALAVGGPATVSCTDSSVTPPLVGTNTLTVNPSKKTPTKMSLQFGDPQAATA